MKLLVLDLDETLIYATETLLHKEPDFVLYPYFFYKRPGVEKFIRQMSDIFYIGIWTASTHDYARIVVQNIIPNDVNIKFVWSREKCTPRFNPDTYEHNYMKNLDKLKKLGYNLESVIMVDDTPKKLARHYGNLVHVIPFEGQDEDNELPKLAIYLEHLSKVQNVRRVEKRNWHLKV